MCYVCLCLRPMPVLCAGTFVWVHLCLCTWYTMLGYLTQSRLCIGYSFSRTAHTLAQMHAHTSNYECPSALLLLLQQQLSPFQLPSCFMCSIYRLCIQQHTYIALSVVITADAWSFSFYIWFKFDVSFRYRVVVFAAVAATADVVVFHNFFLPFSIICFAIAVRSHYVANTSASTLTHSWTSNAFFHTHTRTHSIAFGFVSLHDLQIHYAF